MFFFFVLAKHNTVRKIIDLMYIIILDMDALYKICLNSNRICLYFPIVNLFRRKKTFS